MGIDAWRDEQEWPLARTDWQKWHLHSGGSHLKGPTADYLTERHKLAARFYTFVAHQLEPLLTEEMYADDVASV